MKRKTERSSERIFVDSGHIWDDYTYTQCRKSYDAMCWLGIARGFLHG